MTPARRTIALVARREITERMRSRAFAIATLAIIAVVLAGVVLPGLGDETTRLRVGLTGATPSALSVSLRDSARANGARVELRRYPTLAAGERALRNGQAGVLIVDGQRLVWKSEPGVRLAAAVTAAVQRVRAAERAASLGLSAAQATALLAPAPLPARSLQAPDPDRDSREAIAFVGFLVLLTVILWYGSAVAEGVAQEKGNRVMELLLCRVRPRDLLAGKVLGIGLVGLAQILLAITAGAAAILSFETLDVPAAVPATLVAAAVSFALGYAFWSVAYAAVGALVSRVEDLQAAVSPLNWTLTLSALTAMVAADSPDAWYSRVASFVPITAPFVMPVRIAVSHVATWEIALAVTIMIASTLALVRLAGAVYSGALLRTGGRPALRDVWHAARAG
jgi:ABC-2 type transport system permease protein